jgi:hypothetical protein
MTAGRDGAMLIRPPMKPNAILDACGPYPFVSELFDGHWGSVSNAHTQLLVTVDEVREYASTWHDDMIATWSLVRSSVIDNTGRKQPGNEIRFVACQMMNGPATEQVTEDGSTEYTSTHYEFGDSVFMRGRVFSMGLNRRIGSIPRIVSMRRRSYLPPYGALRKGTYASSEEPRSILNERARRLHDLDLSGYHTSLEEVTADCYIFEVRRQWKGQIDPNSNWLVLIPMTTEEEIFADTDGFIGHEDYERLFNELGGQAFNGE